MYPDKHKELKEALRLLNISLRGWSKTLISPNTGKSISHTAVIRVSQGHEETEWIQSEIESIINKAKEQFPEYYKAKGGTTYV
ncbi:MAG: hypothetical protein WEA58_04160 [Balneolaceae bacterium]